MKIKLQSGGVAYLPTTNQIGAAQQTTGAASSESAGKVPGFTKEVIDLVKEYGLDSDVSVFLNQVGRVLDLANDPTGENLSMREILKIQKLANKVKQNYNDYQKTYQSLESQDAWGEPATTARGYLYVQGEDGKISTISPTEYNNNRDKYNPLTNQELLWYRRSNPSMAFQDDILDNLSATVGMKDITDYARALINEFETTTITGYSEKQAAAIRSGLEHIVSGDIGNFRGVLQEGPDGIYKISQESTIADTNIEAALNYLVTTLPNTYKNTLNAKASAEGYNPQAMLLQMMMYNTGRKIAADFDKQATEDLLARRTGTTKDSTSMVQGTLPDDIARGSLPETTFYISPNASTPKDRAIMSVTGGNGGLVTDKSKEPLYQNNLEIISREAYGMRGGDWSQASFGNQAINYEDLKTLVWDGKSNITRVVLPYTHDEHGQIVPDLDLLIKFNTEMAYIKEHPGISQQEIQQRLQSISDKVTVSNGMLVIKPEYMQEFLSISAYANRDNLDIKDISKPFLQHLSKEQGRVIKDDYNKLVQYGKLDPARRATKSHSVSSARSNDFYYGNVYIPITDATQGFRMSNEQYYPRDTFSQVIEKDILRQNSQQIQASNPWVTSTPTN